MKKLIWSSILVIALLLSSCDKHPFDYRNKYLGDWSFVTIQYGYNWGATCNDTIAYDGKIVYGYKDNELEIEFLDNVSRSICIDKDGNITEFPSEESFGQFTDENALLLFVKDGDENQFCQFTITGVKK